MKSNKMSSNLYRFIKRFLRRRSYIYKKGEVYINYTDRTDSNIEAYKSLKYIKKE